MKVKFFLKGDFMEYNELENGQEFIEDGRRYIVSKNWSHFLHILTPFNPDVIIVFRPDDSGLTFRAGTMPKDNIVLTVNILSDKEIQERNKF